MLYYKQIYLTINPERREDFTKLISIDCDSLKSDKKMDKTALFHLEYGLYILSAREKDKDNACVINTVMQVTDKPVQICVAVNHANLTHDMIIKDRKFNVSILTQDAPFEIYSDFGYVSGREKDKFAGRTDITRSENGIYYLTEHTNAFLSAEIKNTVSLSTHTLFFGEVTEAVSLSESPSVTYNYYQKNIKPRKSDKAPAAKKGYICEVCGYIYEGDSLPENYICPVCKHGAEAFRALS